MITNSLTYLWMFLIPLVAILIPVLVDQRYGMYARKRSDKVEDGPIGSAVGSAMGLFAFMLAFTFQIVGNRYDKRRELLVIEVSGIRTTYLNARLVPEPYRSGTRTMLVDYVDIRIKLFHDPLKLPQVGSRSRQILDTLWNYSEALAAQDRSFRHFRKGRLRDIPFAWIDLCSGNVAHICA